ncbi:hypothetical protein PSPO01_16129 [Paraphaeosphaeria sporulosa]
MSSLHMYGVDRAENVILGQNGPACGGENPGADPDSHAATEELEQLKRVQLARLAAHSASSSINARPAAEVSTAVTLEKALLAA